MLRASASGLMQQRAQQRSQPRAFSLAQPRMCVSQQLASAAPVCSRRVWSRSYQAPVAMATKTATIKMVIQGRKLQVTEAIKAYVESKISKAVANFGQEVKEVDVTLSARGGDTGTHGKKEQKVDVTIYTLRNGVVRVEERDEVLYAAIDVVCDKLARKMVRIKERAITKGKWPGRAGPKGGKDEDADFKEYVQEVAYETAVFDRDEALTRQFAALNKEFPATVLRTKSLQLEPMSVDDAIEQMDAIGHDFFVFRELESDSIQVVYKRKQEGYGVLIPSKKD